MTEFFLELEEESSFWQTKEQISCKGRQGFEDYFQHVTRFRRAVDKLMLFLNGKAIIKACDVSHPSTPDIIRNKIEEISQNYIRQCLETNTVLDCLKFSEHQPYAIRETFATIVSNRFANHTITPEQILLLFGSSTQWLDMLIRTVIVKSLHRDVANKEPVKLPIVLTPAGSFKCGGYFPYASGGALHYIPTAFSNSYKLTPELLAAEIEKINSDTSKKVVCILLETPTALGQNYTVNELADIAAVLSLYPDILWIQDWYSLGTEHDDVLPNALADNLSIAKQGCTISSFRRDWGGAAAYANVSVMQSFNDALIQELSLQCSETYFYVRPPLQKLQSFVTHHIVSEMKHSEFQKKNQFYFKKQFSEYEKAVHTTNEWLNTALGTAGIRYLFTNKVQSGQFGFLFFNQDTMKKGKIKNGTEIAELMCLYSKCRVMPTLLSPMGIGVDPVGVRLNICLSEDGVANKMQIDDMLERMGALVLAIEQGSLVHPQFASLISTLQAGKEVNLQQLTPVEQELLCIQPI